MKTKTKKQTMMERIEAHGLAILEAFPTAPEKDPLRLCKRLRRIEVRLHALAEGVCSGSVSMDGEWATETERARGQVEAILGPCPGLFFNADSRGYAVKIDDEWGRNRGLRFHRDWGGYFILAPDLRES